MSDSKKVFSNMFIWRYAFTSKVILALFTAVFLSACGGGSDSNDGSDNNDTDGDGVNNTLDLCAATSSGATVDATGCSSIQLDTDQDGVANTLDQCVGTAVGATVNAVGCSQVQLDGDLDGVENTQDECPDTASGQTVDGDGCADAQKDTDGDTVTDDVDACPATPANEPVDSTGCGTVTQNGDADGDGVLDSNEPAACLNTPQGESVDSNGCGPSQLDSDNDGVTDDADDCANTPNNEVVDAAGCGLLTQGGADTDSDGDTVTDTFDDCPNTQAGEEVDTEGCAASQKDSDLDSITDDLDFCNATPAGEEINLRGCSLTTESTFTEVDGLVVVEMESTNYGDGWILKTGLESTGRGFLEWQGGNNFNNPGAAGIIEIPIAISTAGTYRFSWRNIVNMGDASTDSNDAWLRIQADTFFGLKTQPGGGNEASEVGHIVCPIGAPAANNCAGVEPNGASGAGYLKVYRTGSNLRAWNWVTGTSDNDRHEVFATFNTPGVYTVTISGRSNGHAIDRFVMHLSENTPPTNDISNNNATDEANEESARQ